MLTKANETHTQLLAALLGAPELAAVQAHASTGQKLPARLQEDVFTLRMRAAFRCYGAAHAQCVFYIAVQDKTRRNTATQSAQAHDGAKRACSVSINEASVQASIAPQLPSGLDIGAAAAQPDATGLLCVQGRNALYCGGLHDADEMQAFLSVLQVETFQSNSMLLPNWRPLPRYLMHLPAGGAVHVCAAAVDEHPNLWKLAHSEVLSGIDVDAWYADACVRVNCGVADVRAIAAPQGAQARASDVAYASEKQPACNAISHGNDPSACEGLPADAARLEPTQSQEHLRYAATAGAYAVDAAGIYITAVETALAYRGYGYGCTLISSLARDYADRDKWLICQPALHGFYEQLGFVFARPVCEYRAPK